MYQKLNPTLLISTRMVPLGAFAAESVVLEILLILYWRHHQLHLHLD